MDKQVFSAAQGLLRHSRELVRHQDEIARATGEHFNLFHILGVEHYEVSTHSALLRELLDPRGSHGQGATFLKCFFAVLDLQQPIDADNATVDSEFGIGPRTEAEGGRLDLLITYDGLRIVIENKIYAGEQPNWVSRYLDWLKGNGCLFYLTLRPERPVEIDKGDEDSVRCISYATTIIKWLEVCRKEVPTVPIVRESLTQYIHLIQKLTHQNTSSRMNDEIIKSVLDDKENFKAYCALRDADRAIKWKIIHKLVERVQTLVPEGFRIVETPKGNFAKNEGFFFSTPELTARHLMAGIAFEKHFYSECFYGFQAQDSEQSGTVTPDVREVLCKHFDKKFGRHEESTPNWPAWQWWEGYREWNDDVLKTIEFNQGEFDKRLLKLIVDLHEVAASFAKEMSQRI